MGLQEAAERVKNITKRPTNSEFLKLYGLYKQASQGDVDTDRPGGFDFKGAAKWDAWKEQEGKSQQEAEKAYIALVDDIVEKYG